MKKKIIYSCLLSLSVFACSIPNQEIKNDKINIKSNTKDKKFKTKSLSTLLHPNIATELNEEAYYYAHPDVKAAVDLRKQQESNNQPINPPSLPQSGYTHYKDYAKYYTYQDSIRNYHYFKALQCIDEGFNEKSYYDARPDVKYYVDLRAYNIANNLPVEAWWPISGYAHYRNYARYYEPSIVKTQAYFNALKTNKIFREEAYFNAHPNIHSTIKYALDNNFTTSNFVNAYEHYILNRDTNPDYSSGNEYTIALEDHINGYWEDSYLYTFTDILFAVDGDQNTAPILPSGYSHYNPYGRNENRLSNPSYQNAVNNVDIHSGQSKAVDFYEGVIVNNQPTNSNQVKVYRFHVLPNRKYRFLLSEMDENDAYLKIKDQNGNVIVENDDTYGLDSYVEFNSGNNIDRYTVEVTTSNNGIPSTNPQGLFILTMFHSFKI